MNVKRNQLNKLRAQAINDQLDDLKRTRLELAQRLGTIKGWSVANYREMMHIAEAAELQAMDLGGRRQDLAKQSRHPIGLLVLPPEGNFQEHYEWQQMRKYLAHLISKREEVPFDPPRDSFRISFDLRDYRVDEY